MLNQQLEYHSVLLEYSSWQKKLISPHGSPYVKKTLKQPDINVQDLGLANHDSEGSQ